MSKVYVKKSRTHGLGVFAKRNIKKGEIVLVWRGKKTKLNEIPYDSLNNDHLLQVSKNQWLCLKPSQKSSHVNHNCEPNCGIRGNVTLVAMRNIKADEEINFDYSTNVLEEDWKMKCNCGSKNCREVIRSHHFLPEKSKKKYRNFTSKFILEELNTNGATGGI